MLNQAQEKAEKTVDELCERTGQKKRRMYHKRARKDYLRLSKSKKRSAKAIRSAVRKQLKYIRRDMGFVAELVQKGAKLSSKQTDRLNVVTSGYEQQLLSRGILPLKAVLSIFYLAFLEVHKKSLGHPGP